MRQVRRQRSVIWKTLWVVVLAWTIAAQLHANESTIARGSVDKAEVAAFVADKPVALRSQYARLLREGHAHAIANQLRIASETLEQQELGWANRALVGALYRLERECVVNPGGVVVRIDWQPTAGACDATPERATHERAYIALENLQRRDVENAYVLTVEARSSHALRLAGGLVASGAKTPVP